MHIETYERYFIFITGLLTFCFAFNHRVSSPRICPLSVVFFYVSICFNLALMGNDITHGIKWYEYNCMCICFPPVVQMQHFIMQSHRKKTYHLSCIIKQYLHSWCFTHQLNCIPGTINLTWIHMNPDHIDIAV